MNSISEIDSEPITSKDKLIEYLASGCKTPDKWRIGTEHEKFLYLLEDYSPLRYDGPRGVEVFLKEMQRFGWKPIREEGNIIALNSKNKGAVTLEPGGQLELSGAQLKTVHETCSEVHEHRLQIGEVAKELNIGVLGIGMIPNWKREDVNWVPKERYRIMRSYMPKVGKLGLDMMTRTCTVQVNLDYESEVDMVKKLRVSTSLQPISTALWSNSPFTENKPNGAMSQRAICWQNTDSDRTGMIPFIFNDNMSFEKYVDYALDVPMYFIRRKKYIDVSGQSFRSFLNGKISGFEGELPSLTDWEDHLSTIFPEVRLKRFLEMRGADSGSWSSLCALPAFWTGILYDRSSIDAAWDIAKNWKDNERQKLYLSVPREGLNTIIQGTKVIDIAKELLNISIYGLKSRARLDHNSNDESIFLEPLLEILQTGKTPAEKLLDKFSNSRNNNIDYIFKEYGY